MSLWILQKDPRSLPGSSSDDAVFSRQASHLCILLFDLTLVLNEPAGRGTVVAYKCTYRNWVRTMYLILNQSTDSSAFAKLEVECRDYI